MGGPPIRHIAIFDDEDGIGGEIGFELRWQPDLAALYDKLMDGTCQARVIAAAQEDVVDLLAGEVAQLRYRSQVWSKVNVRGHELAQSCPFHTYPCDEDLGQARPRLEFLLRHGILPSLMPLWERAAGIIELYWTRLIALAHMLIAHGRLNAGQVQDWWFAGDREFAQNCRLKG